MSLLAKQRCVLHAGHLPWGRLTNKIHVAAQLSFTVSETTTQILVAFSMELARVKVIEFTGASDRQREKDVGSANLSNK